jgi:hypothetical protein
MGHAAITLTADTYADEQFDNIAVRLTRWLTFRQTATRSCGPNLAPYGPIAGLHDRPAGATFTL